MSWTEGTGKTVEEATQAALEESGLDEDQAEVEVLAEPGGRRFLGLGGQAKVRVRPLDEEEGEGETAAPPEPEEIAACATEFLEGLIETMGLEGTISSRAEEGVVFVQVDGDKLGLLIGKQGRTLQALHEVTRTVVQRRLHCPARLVLDVGGYRARRREALGDYARQLAEKVRESGKEIALEPMNASDRKVVHDAINDEAGVATYSEGREPKRCVVISPD